METVLTYDEAHRHADTLFPRQLWDLAQKDLAPIRSTCGRLADEMGAQVRFNLSVKHPHPACIVVKRIRRTEVAVELWAETAGDTFVFRLGVKRTPLGLFFRSRCVPTWEPMAVFSRDVVQTGQQTFVREVEIAVRRAFGVDERLA